MPLLKSPVAACKPPESHGYHKQNKLKLIKHLEQMKGEKEEGGWGAEGEAVEAILWLKCKEKHNYRGRRAGERLSDVHE